jgi:hydroxymethylpyrimidine/phosphomethylpyrimidine kinase
MAQDCKEEVLLYAVRVNEQKQVPIVLTVAGSDSSAGAGIQADLKSIAGMGGYGLNAVTAVVSETPGVVSMVHLVPLEVVTDQIKVLSQAFPIGALKTGMLGSAALVETVVSVLEAFLPRIPVVVDPVMVATGGGRLLEEEAVETIKQRLLTRARLITPNMDEAGVLWGKPVTTRQEMMACASDLASDYGVAVLVKGGHLAGDTAADVLCDGSGRTWYEAGRVENVNTHGTGCSYSAAIATGLAQGLSLSEAVAAAKDFVSAAITNHLTWARSGARVQALNHLQQ